MVPFLVVLQNTTYMLMFFVELQVAGQKKILTQVPQSPWLTALCYYAVQSYKGSLSGRLFSQQ